MKIFTANETTVQRSDQTHKEDKKIMIYKDHDLKGMKIHDFSRFDENGKVHLKSFSVISLEPPEEFLSDIFRKTIVRHGVNSCRNYLMTKGSPIASHGYVKSLKSGVDLIMIDPKRMY